MVRWGWMVALAMVSGEALAAEDELVVAVEPGYGLLNAPANEHGGGGAASVWLGLSDDLWLAFSVGGGAFGAPEGADGVTYAEGFGGIVAALDVFRIIPFLEATIGVVVTDASTSPTFRAGVGADYFVSRTISVGAVVRLRPVDEGIGDSIFTAAARIAWRLEL